MSYFKQPQSFYLIFIIELWERFGYYGVQALIVLFMVKELHYTDTRADLLFGVFSAFTYLLPCLGGYIGDALLGTKRTILLGALFLSAGYLLLALPSLVHHYLTYILAVIAVGNGLFKANPSSLLAKCYQKEPDYDPDSGFTLYYMAINIGAFCSMALTPIISHYFGWEAAFFVCFLGMSIGLINFVIMRGRINTVGSPPDFNPLNRCFLALVLIGALLLCLLCGYLLTVATFTTSLILMASLVYFLIYIYHICQASSEEKKPMILFALLFFQGVVFFILYIQMQTSLTLFASRNVTHSIGFFPVEPASFQALNPFWIIILSPILAVFYQRAQSKGNEISVVTKFACGIILTGLSFVLLYAACHYYSQSGVIAGEWLVGSYGLQSLGELLVSALGLSVAARYVPQRLMGFAMGIWLLSTSLASIIGSHLASMAAIPEGLTSPVFSLSIYSRLFYHLGFITVGIGLFCLLLSPLLKRLEPAPPVLKRGNEA